MVPTDSEIETTRKQSDTLARQAAALLADAGDPDKDIGKLLADASGQIDRLAGLMTQDGLSDETGLACMVAAVDTIDDWVAVEVAACEGLAGAHGSVPASAPPRGGPRRGVRI